MLASAIQKCESAISILFFFNVEKKKHCRILIILRKTIFVSEERKFSGPCKISVHGMSLTRLNPKFSLKLGKTLITVIFVMFYFW